MTSLRNTIGRNDMDPNTILQMLAVVALLYASGILES